MPIYEYQCEACGHVFEKLQKISDALLTKCPDCDAEALKKLVSAPAFRLKGAGWYETDFKTGSKKNVVQPDKKAKSTSKKESTASPGGTSKTRKSSGTG